MGRSLIGRAGAAAAVVLVMLAGPAAALEELKDEKDRLRACERRLCRLVTQKTPATGAFACDLTKTWARHSIKEGSASRNVSWAFGDARCSVNLKLDNAAIIGALKGAEATLEFPQHTVECTVERENGVTPVTLKLAPRLTFRNGRVHKIWLNLKEVDGPAAIKGLAFSVAKLEDSVGVFHKPLVKAVNTLISEKCPKVAAAG